MKKEKISVCDCEKRCALRWVMLGAGSLFGLFSFVYFAKNGGFTDILLSAVTVIFILSPFIIEKFFVCRLNTAFCIFAFFYSLFPILGYSYKFYYLVPGWDKLMHFSGGVVFAVVGAYIPLLLKKEYTRDILMRALFAIMFSISISALWEFYEFTADRVFGTDMQNDTIVYSINSYMLGSGTGVVGSIDKIESVIVNGEALPGYLDIGLIDTMFDMIFETAGALIYTIIFAADRDRHPVFRKIKKASYDALSASD